MKGRATFTFAYIGKALSIANILTEDELEIHIGVLNYECKDALKAVLIENLSESGLKPQDVDIQFESIVER